MLIYVIPFLILLVVLVLLKKRQDAQGSDKATATTATQKAKAKKASSSAKIAPNKTQPVENTVIEKKKSSALSEDTRAKIEALIQERSFFSAEAQINQALKKDNSQHELYLYLLDIHILQKDEFAISQLLNHLQSLELDEILPQAEAKKANFEQSQNKADETINFVSPSMHTESASIAQKQQNNADFDALMAGAAPVAEEKTALSFDQLQDTAPPKTDFSQSVAPVTNDIKPLDFNLSFDSAPKAEAPAPIDAPSINFDSFSVQETQPEVQVEQQAPTAEIKPLDFSLSFAPEAKTEPESSAQEQVQPLDFSFAVEKTEPAEAPAISPSPLSFDLSSLDTETTVQIAPDVEKTASTDLSFETSHAQVTPVSTADQNDPLVQSFPELVEANEITMNLELAQQYLKLGAFDAMRELLAEKEAEYSAEQRQQADLLLNQIAS